MKRRWHVASVIVCVLLAGCAADPSTSDAAATDDALPDETGASSPPPSGTTGASAVTQAGELTFDFDVGAAAMHPCPTDGERCGKGAFTLPADFDVPANVAFIVTVSWDDGLEYHVTIDNDEQVEVAAVAGASPLGMTLPAANATAYAFHATPEPASPGETLRVRVAWPAP